MSIYIGDVEFTSQLLNASGPSSITSNQLLDLNKTVGLGGIVTKSFTLDHQDGNPTPNYYYDEKTKTSINAIGLANYGAKYYFDFIKTNSYQLVRPVFLSIAEQNVGKLLELFNEYLNTSYSVPLLIEYNISCPNVNGARITGYDPTELKKRLQYIKSFFFKTRYITFGLKLPPYLDRYQLKDVAEVINEFKDIVKFITVCNTMGNGCFLDDFAGTPRLSTNIGGVGGKALKPIALGNVRLFSGYLDEDIQIIGCGGVTELQDIYDFMFAGATFVQIGTKVFEEGPSVISDFYRGLYREV